MTSLDDLAFIHLQIAVRGAALSKLTQMNRALDATMRDVEDGEDGGQTAVRNPPMEALPKLFPLILADSDQHIPVPIGDEDRLATKAGDFQSLVGPAFELQYRRTEERRPIWFSWQADGFDRGLAAPLLALSGALRSLGLAFDGAESRFGANIEYLVCREMSGSHLRGKGQLSLALDHIPRTFDEPTAEARASQISSRLEGAWRSELHGEISELSVAWRENWLGHRID